MKTLGEEQVRAEGKSRFGKLRVRSTDGEKHVQNGGNLRYYGNYAVEFEQPNGKKTKLPPLEKLELEQAEQIADIQVFSFDGYDVLIYQPKQFAFSQGYEDGSKTVFAYAVTAQGDAFPLAFRYATSGGVREESSIALYGQLPLAADHGRLISHGYAGERFYELSWTPDAERKVLQLAEVRDKTEEAEGLNRIVDPYSLRLAQALGLTDMSFPDGPMNEDRLRGLFTGQAWSNPGFQRLLRDFEKSAEEGNPSRAFPWQPIHARYDDKGNIRVTFTFNLFYAVGWAAHLDAILKDNGSEWTFHDFGTLRTEYADIVEEEDEHPMKPYNGLVIQDPLEV